MAEDSVMEYNPPRFFWALRLRSGEELWQFHPETGKELLVKDLKEKHPDFLNETAVLVLLPFTSDLAEKVLQSEGMVCRPMAFQPTRIDLEEGWRPIFYRTQAIHMGANGGLLRETFYHIGYQYNVGGKNVKVIVTRDDSGMTFVNHPHTRKVPKFFEEKERPC